MQKLISEKQLVVHNTKEISVAVLRLEEFSRAHGIPKTLVNKVRLMLVELLDSLIQGSLDPDYPVKIRIYICLYEQGRLSIKIVQRGLESDPFHRTIAGYGRFENDLTVDTLGLHLVRKHMDHYSYHRALDHNVIFLSKERV